MAESPDNELGELQELIVRIGIAMTVAGEPVDATQDRLYRIGEARGLKNLEIAVLPTTLLVQVGDSVGGTRAARRARQPCGPSARPGQ